MKGKQKPPPVIEKIHVSFDVNVRRLQRNLQTKSGREIMRAFAAEMLRDDIKVWERKKKGKSNANQ